jgi:hypothetical protein
MDDDSLNFGSPATVATPNSNSILAQPPLQGEDANGSGQGDGVAQGTNTDGNPLTFSGICSYKLNTTPARYIDG